ncbi:transcriptional regulator [Isoptericola halotolerans]|uniref:Phenylacetic acid degradation operon negative regulatory protein n=1 Tax=Isoptericola halotolerans TaxID=300560 RepID=A0ABX2AA80_9MICO|nr:PaaX family transcriptional regulator [Isoptericola halotolerans]NOV98773.1 phenylacetic acid degradation operon negative regulatory protein [Isoptericola halotolerans]
MSAVPLPIAPRTVIEAFLPADGQVPLDVVFDTANAAGIADQPLRLALRRMVAAGDIVQAGRGRSGTAELTLAGRQRLGRDRLALRLAFAQDQGLAPWDGRWRLLAVSTPEADRAARDALRRQLVDTGAAAVSTGLYLSPHNLADMLDTHERSHLVQATATGVDVRGVTDPQAVTEALWPRARIIEAYAVVDQAIEHVQLAMETGAEAALVGQLHLAEALEQAMRSDPLIPLELRTEPWAPTQIRRRWHDAWAALTRDLAGELLYLGWLPQRP